VSDHVEHYRDALDAWNRRDLVWILEQAAPDFEFHTAGLFPGIESVYSGREGMVEFWTTFIEEPWALFELQIDSLDEVGDDRVLALLTFSGTDRESGQEVTKPYAHLATFRGAEVARIDAFPDWESARAAAIDA
jgi:ketosteroid isomerase-like protein